MKIKKRRKKEEIEILLKKFGVIKKNNPIQPAKLSDFERISYDGPY